MHVCLIMIISLKVPSFPLLPHVRILIVMLVRKSLNFALRKKMASSRLSLVGCPEFLDSVLLCMDDCVDDTFSKSGISFAKEYRNKDKGLLQMDKESNQKIEWCPSVGLEPSMPGLQLDFVTTDSNLIHASKFCTA